MWSLPQSRQPELMDDPALDEGEHMRALGALARINALSRTAAQLAGAVVGIVGRDRLRPGGPPVRIVDVACGGGDVTLALARRLGRRGAVEMLGVDVSTRAVDRSRSLADRAGCDVRFAVRDVIRDGCPPCDVAVSSLFLHHLDDAEARDLLTAMRHAAVHGVAVSDLVRSRVGLALAAVGTSVLASSRVARVDGPLSVRAARTPAEYAVLCTAAGLTGAHIRRVWPERVLVCWRRPGEAA